MVNDNEANHIAKPAGHNVALLDPSVLMPIYHWHTTGKPLNVAGLLGLFQLSEAIVLHETLVVPNEWRYGREPLGKTDEAWLHSIADCFQLHDDLVAFSIYFGIPNDDAFDRAMGFCMHLEKQFKDIWTDLNILCRDKKKHDYAIIISDALNIVHRGWKWQVPFVLNPFWEHFFGAEDLETYGAQRAYEKIADGFKQEIEKIQQLGAPIPIAIPPIPAVSLERSRGNPSKYWSELKALRQEFSPFRRKFAQLHDRFSSPTEKIGTLIQARRELIDEVESAAKQVCSGRSDGRLLSEFWNIVGSVKGSGQDIELGFSASANFKGIITGLAKWFKTFRIKRRARALFDLYAKSLRIKDYGNLVGSSIAVLDGQQIRAVEDHARQVQELIKTDRKKDSK